MKKLIRKIINHLVYWLGHDYSFWKKLPRGKWHHVVVTYQLNGPPVVYLDGKEY